MTRHLATLVLLALGLEAAALSVHHARTGRGLSPRAMGGSLGAGLFLALALRAEAGRRPSARASARASGRVAVLLALAGGAHLMDLRQRLHATRS